MSKSKRQDGWWYPWLFVAAFGVIIAVNGTMAYLAVDSWTGLETEKPFQRGQAYNAELAQKSAQANLGWNASAQFESVPTADNAHAGFVHLGITDREGRGISGLSVETLAMRPIQEGYDQNLIFAERGPGTYVAPIQVALPGQWELRFTATRADDVFKMRQRIQVP
ncbi:MAG: FixH family protein [Rhodospirillales bacterium]|nr:FixH family protein [Rhodospirillales bacterium]